LALNELYYWLEPSFAGTRYNNSVFGATRPKGVRHRIGVVDKRAVHTIP
jgi:hypothetical protein